MCSANAQACISAIFSTPSRIFVPKNSVKSFFLPRFSLLFLCHECKDAYIPYLPFSLMSTTVMHAYQAHELQLYVHMRCFRFPTPLGHGKYVFFLMYITALPSRKRYILPYGACPQSFPGNQYTFMMHIKQGMQASCCFFDLCMCFFSAESTEFDAHVFFFTKKVAHASQDDVHACIHIHICMYACMNTHKHTHMKNKI
jgi:hypothetical protein